MRAFIVFCCIVTSVFLMTCSGISDSEKTSQKSTVINPNGDSELALLMRHMFDDLMRVKDEAAKGKSSKFHFDPQAIFTAHATEPEKAASETYQQMGKAYLVAHRAFEKAEPAEKKAHFTGIVQNCIACHQQLCPGPIRRIEKLLY